MCPISKEVSKELDSRLATGMPFTGYDVAKATGEKNASLMIRESFNNGGMRWQGWATTQADTMPAELSFRPKGPVIYFKVVNGYTNELHLLLLQCDSPWAKAKQQELKVEKVKEWTENLPERPTCLCGKSYSRMSDLRRHVRKGGKGCS